MLFFFERPIKLPPVLIIYSAGLDWDLGGHVPGADGADWSCVRDVTFNMDERERLVTL